MDRLLYPIEIGTPNGSPHGPAGVPHLDLPDQDTVDREIESRAAKADRIRQILREFDPEGTSLLPRLDDIFEQWSGAARDQDLLQQRLVWWGPPTVPPGVPGAGGVRPSPRADFRDLLGPEKGCTNFLGDDRKCSTREGRCWQLEGTVFRAIAEAHPRVVAQKWFEVVTGNAADQGNFPNPFPTPADEINWREKMMERLETALPSKMEMGTYDPAALTPKEQVVAGLTNGIGELLVSSAGLHFPPQVPPGGPGVLANQTTKAFLKEVVVGRAGNPVFTSSDYCA